MIYENFTTELNFELSELSICKANSSHVHTLHHPFDILIQFVHCSADDVKTLSTEFIKITTSDPVV